jgi:hypothetical protein
MGTEPKINFGDVPVAYHNIMNVIFDYGTGHDLDDKHLGRNEYFEKISKILPPDELAKWIAESGVVKVDSEDTPNMESVAVLLSEKYNLNAFTQVEVRRLNRYIINRLIQRTNAQF